MCLKTFTSTHLRHISLFCVMVVVVCFAPSAEGTAIYTGTMASGLFVSGIFDSNGVPLNPSDSGVVVRASIDGTAVEVKAGNAATLAIISAAISGNPDNLGIGEGPTMAATTLGRADLIGLASTTVTAFGTVTVENSASEERLIEFALSANATGSASVDDTSIEFALVLASAAVGSYLGAQTFQDVAIAPSDDQVLSLKTEERLIARSPPNSEESAGYQFQLFGVATAIPEPSTYLLFVIGILAVIGIGYQQRKKVA